MTLLQPTTWQDIFTTWEANEGADPVWQRFAMVEKGWPNWSSWREYQMNLYPLADKGWSLYRIDEPNDCIPQFRVGPYRGFQKWFEVPHVHTFADLVTTASDWVRENIGVKSRLGHFPQPTQFIGLYIERNDTIVLVEGHHRAAAVALAVADGDPIAFHTLPTIALTTISGDEFPMLDHVLDTPSSNPLTTL